MGLASRSSGTWRQRAGVPVARLQHAARGPGHKAQAHQALESWQNGKFVRMNRTLAQEWQYAHAWESKESRAEALDSFIEHYNWDRPHSACGACPRCHASSA